MESDYRFFARRAAAEASAAARAVTPEGRERRLSLARTYAERARACMSTGEELAA